MAFNAMGSSAFRTPGFGARRGDFRHMLRPPIQPHARLGVVAMPVIDGAYRTIDVIEDAVLDDAWATE